MLTSAIIAIILLSIAPVYLLLQVQALRYKTIVTELLFEEQRKTLFDLYAQHEWLDLRVLELEEKLEAEAAVNVTINHAAIEAAMTGAAQ